MNLKVFYIDGMTCSGCVNYLTNKLEKHAKIDKVSIDLDSGKVLLSLSGNISNEEISDLVPLPYRVVNNSSNVAPLNDEKTKSLWPLLLIFMFLFGVIGLLHYPKFLMKEMMLDFMGGFFLVFSFFKFLNVKGFAKAFAVYDPLASIFSLYGWVYPFIELLLAVFFILDYKLNYAVFLSFLVLSTTTIGVMKHLLKKSQITCACLGSVLNLPMTWATLIENLIMLLMILFYWLF